MTCHVVRIQAELQVDVLVVTDSVIVQVHSPGTAASMPVMYDWHLVPSLTTCRPALLHACLPVASQQGNSAFQAGRYRQAHALYTQALELALVTPSLQAVLYCNRAAALNAEGSYVEAIVDCCLAGELDGSLPRVLQVRGVMWADSTCRLVLDRSFVLSLVRMRHAVCLCCRAQCCHPAPNPQQVQAL